MCTQASCLKSRALRLRAPNFQPCVVVVCDHEIASLDSADSGWVVMIFGEESVDTARRRALGVARDSRKERIFWLVDCMAVPEVGKDGFEQFPESRTRY